MSAVQSPERWLNSPRFKKLRAQFSERSRQDFTALAVQWYGTSELFPKQVTAFGKRLELLNEWPAETAPGAKTPPPPGAGEPNTLALLDFVNDALPLVPGSSILHLNCGDGGLAWHLPNNVFYEGLAFSPEDVDTAKRHVSHHVFQRLDIFSMWQKVPRPRYDLVLVTLDNPVLFSRLQEFQSVPNLAFPSAGLTYRPNEQIPRAVGLAGALPHSFATFLLQFASYARKASGLVVATRVVNPDYGTHVSDPLVDPAWFPYSPELSARVFNAIYQPRSRAAKIRILLDDPRLSADASRGENLNVRIGSSTDDPRPIAFSDVRLTVGTPRLPYRFKRGQKAPAALRAGVAGLFVSFGSPSEMAIWQLQNPEHHKVDLKLWSWTHIVLDLIERRVEQVTEAAVLAYFARFEVPLPRLLEVDPQLLVTLARRVQEARRLNTPYPQRMTARGRYFTLGPHTPLLRGGKRFKVALSKPDFIPGSPPTVYIEEEV